MAKHLLLVDYENVPKIDLSELDVTYRAIVFLGAGQGRPRASRKQETAHRFKRVDFYRITGAGRNALDFHIAFHLGRMFETSRETICIVVSRDKGYDPLLQHLNSKGLQCRRIESFAEIEPEKIVCARCRQSRTVELHGGRWCTNCGRFASPPDPEFLPSNQPGFQESRQASANRSIVCSWCHQSTDVGDGIYDDGEWMCGDCIAAHA